MGIYIALFPSIFILTIAFNNGKAQENCDNIIAERQRLIDSESNQYFGSEIQLNSNESIFNEKLMNLKHKYLENVFKSPKLFSKHFFQYKEEIKNMDLYKIIKKMPKGAILHIHDMGLLGPDYMLNITYRPNLYVCKDDNNNTRFKFSTNISLFNKVKSCENKWELLSIVRNKTVDRKKFDSELRKLFTIVVDNPNEVYTDINVVWKKFQRYFITAMPLFSYKPVWKDYFYDSLKAFRDDNVMYVEVRSVLPTLYDLNGSVYTPLDTMKVYYGVLEQFRNDYPDFLGAKIIFSPLRNVEKERMVEYIQLAKEIKKHYPDFFAGFDLVGQEDLGKPLNYFLPTFCEASNDINYFFHAGESNWNGMTTDENLIDAIILNASRIGHAFALDKHPIILDKVIEKNIGIECNIISNHVLKLVADERNHPLASYFARNVSVILSSDDPGVWEADPASHDFFVAFVKVASYHADLRLLKKLAINSLHHSNYGNKSEILQEFYLRWEKFIKSQNNKNEF